MKLADDGKCIVYPNTHTHTINFPTGIKDLIKLHQKIFL